MLASCARLVTHATIEEEKYREQNITGGLSRTSAMHGAQIRCLAQKARHTPLRSTLSRHHVLRQVAPHLFYRAMQENSLLRTGPVLRSLQLIVYFRRNWARSSASSQPSWRCWLLRACQRGRCSASAAASARFCPQAHPWPAGASPADTSGNLTCLLGIRNETVSPAARLFM